MEACIVIITPKRQADVILWLVEREAVGPFESREAAREYIANRTLGKGWEATVVPLTPAPVPA